MKVIKFKNHILKIQNNGTIFWPKKSISIISDLHLEKSSYFAKKGLFVPPYDSYETLLELNKNLINNEIKIVVILGDFFHDNNGYKRLNQKSKLILKEIISNYKVIFIKGNHDNLLEIPNVQSHSSFIIDGINLSHEPKNIMYEICGHFHPKIVLNINGKKISKKCFIVTQHRIFMPSFGYYTGGLSVKNSVFKKYITNNCKYFIIGKKIIFEVKNH